MPSSGLLCIVSHLLLDAINNNSALLNGSALTYVLLYFRTVITINILTQFKQNCERTAKMERKWKHTRINRKHTSKGLCNLILMLIILSRSLTASS
jgi:hypothetical protein